MPSTSIVILIPTAEGAESVTVQMKSIVSLGTSASRRVWVVVLRLTAPSAPTYPASSGSATL